MTELFGSNNELQLRSFVDDVGRVQRGELIVELDDEKEEETGKVPKATTMPLVTLTKTSLPRKTEAAVPSNKKATSASTTKKAVPVAKLSASIPNSSKTTKDFTEYKQSPLTADQGSQSALRKEDEGSAGATPIIKTPPPKGTAAFICGCFGSIHKALTNCLFCGRISCEKEGYDYCPFCGYLVEEVKSWADG